MPRERENKAWLQPREVMWQGTGLANEVCPPDCTDRAGVLPKKVCPTGGKEVMVATRVFWRMHVTMGVM